MASARRGDSCGSAAQFRGRRYNPVGSWMLKEKVYKEIRKRPAAIIGAMCRSTLSALAFLLGLVPRDARIADCGLRTYPIVARLAAAGRLRGFCDISGSLTKKLAPCPGPGLEASTVPPWSSTRCFAMDRPMPSPHAARVVDESAWRKRSNTYGRNSDEIPCPESLTRMPTCASA